ncbi:MAG: helix-turn-helix transcriptional regulator [Burkholderiaceae bacterium]|nr:helix-turn-helix transcriptional regulator [Burkholderiaceae bacterium]
MLIGPTPQPTPSATSRLTVAAGRVHFWPGGSLWIGHGSGLSDWHEHHALQIALALDGVCRFRDREDGCWSAFTGALVRSHCKHQFEIEGATVAHLFIEPETTAGRMLSRHFAAHGISPLPDAERDDMADLLRAAYRRGARDEAMVATARAAVALLTKELLADDPVDPRIGKALDYIRTHLHAPITLADAAGEAALSPGRFRHLFVQETGSAFRPYLLWLRLNTAIQCAMEGQSWTNAAHEAGFADSAHLTRTFKRMFGINPATLVRV